MSKIVRTPHGIEFSVEWQCPFCKAKQTDTVHPNYGPFVTSTCEPCGMMSCDDDLDPESLAAWEEARTAAEQLSNDDA
jgi:hypothetical protein